MDCILRYDRRRHWLTYTLPPSKAWPDRISVDRDDELHRAWTEVANIAETIAQYEPVWLYASPSNLDAAMSWISHPNVSVVRADLEQLWMRDTGPLISETTDGKPAGVDLNFNYWGSKLTFPKSYDTTLASRILADQKLNRTQAPFTAEGGALEFDGEGTLLATESSILNPNRNPDVAKETLEQYFHALFGVTKTIWVPGAAGLEITDSHIDCLARFTRNNTVLLSRPNRALPRDDPSWRIYHQAKEILKSETTAAGHRLRIMEVEEALTIPYERLADSEEVPATSYLNFYLPNGAVVVPQFGEGRTDKEAMKVLSEVWAGREVVGVKLDFLAWLGGGVHCATMQWPLVEVEREGQNGDGKKREDEL